MRIWFGAFCTIAIVLAGGCTTVPPLEQATADIPIGDIVLRVKCELADAFSDRINDPYYRWMATWTAKADLTLLANSQAAITPNGNYMQFRRSAVNTDAGPTSVGGKTFGLVQQSGGKL